MPHFIFNMLYSFCLFFEGEIGGKFVLIQSVHTNVSYFYTLEVVSRDSETQLQVGEKKLKHINYHWKLSKFYTTLRQL